MLSNYHFHTCSSASACDSRIGVGNTRDVKLTAIRPVSLNGAFIFGSKMIHRSICDRKSILIYPVMVV